MKNQDLMDLVFGSPDIKYGLVEFGDLDFEKALDIFEEKGIYYVKCIKRNKPIQIYSTRKTAPEELIRQLWLYRLVNSYDYELSEIEVEKEIYFGTEVKEKAADIVVYQRDGKTPRIIIECKKPNRDDGIVACPQ